jgi:hypothetical protein
MVVVVRVRVCMLLVLVVVRMTTELGVQLRHG